MAKVPQIRFKGFKGEWEYSLLSKFLEVFDKKNVDDSLKAEDILSVSGEYGVVNQIAFHGKSFAGASLKGYRVTNKGNVIYTKSPLKQEPYGIIKANKLGTGIVSALYAVYSTKEGIDASFLQEYFKLDGRLNSYLLPLINKGAKNTILVSDEEAIAGFVNIPNPQEQIAISNFLESIDTLISRRSKELEKMRNIKRALLEKMFPQGDEKVPQIRFGEFKEEYTEQLAKDTFETFVEKNHPELPVLSATQDKGMVIREDIGYNIMHDKRNEAGYKRVLPGQFVIHLRSFQGGFAHSAVEGITSPAYDVFGFKDKQKHDDYYWKYIFCSKSFIKRLETVTYGIRDGRNISYPEFLGLKFVYPKKQEQTKVAKLFASLDNTISARERQVTLLKNMKLALLEQMFVNE